MKDDKDWVEKQNKKIIQLVWIIFVSAVTSLIANLALTM